MVASLEITTGVSIATAETLIATASVKRAITVVFINNKSLVSRKVRLHVGPVATLSNQIGPIIIEPEDCFILSAEKIILESTDALKVWADGSDVNVVASYMEL
jgi:hypothetical protein